MCLHTKMNFLCKGFRKVEYYRQTDRQTHTTENITKPHSHVVKTSTCMHIAPIFHTYLLIIEQEHTYNHYQSTNIKMK